MRSMWVGVRARARAWARFRMRIKLMLRVRLRARRKLMLMLRVRVKRYPCSPKYPHTLVPHNPTLAMRAKVRARARVTIRHVRAVTNIKEQNSFCNTWLKQ